MKHHHGPGKRSLSRCGHVQAEAPSRLGSVAHRSEPRQVGTSPWLTAASQVVKDFVLGTGARAALDFAGMFDSEADLRSELNLASEAVVAETCEVWRRAVRASGREVEQLATSCRVPSVAVGSGQHSGGGLAPSTLSEGWLLSLGSARHSSGGSGPSTLV